MIVKILSAGNCPNCRTVEREVRKAADDLKIKDLEIQVIDDIGKAISYGAMSLPALIVGGKIACSGRVPSKEEIKKYLSGK